MAGDRDDWNSSPALVLKRSIAQITTVDGVHMAALKAKEASLIDRVDAAITRATDLAAQVPDRPMPALAARYSS